MTTTSSILDPILLQLAGLQVGAPCTHGGLTVLPLLPAETGTPADELPGYLTLDRALEAECVRISEIHERGSVPQLRLENLGDRPVLLLDGEELAGAKQNRVLNLTILAPAKQTIVIPVSCVEAGRWRRESRHFTSMDHLAYAGMRGAKMSQVTSSLKAGGTRASDQGAVWNSIASMQKSYSVGSSTSKMADIYTAKRRDLAGYVDAFAPADGQIGAAFAFDGKVRGLELFDHPRTFADVFGKLVRSWALDAMLHAEDADVPGPKKVRKFLERTGRAVQDATEHPAVGLGTDVRLDAPKLVGSSLVHDGRLLHLCAFRAQPARPTRRTGRPGPGDAPHRTGGSPDSRGPAGDETSSASGADQDPPRNLLSRLSSRLMSASRRQRRYRR